MTKLRIIIFALIFGVLLSAPCFAATVTVSPDNGLLTVGFCKIADGTGSNYVLEPPFENSGLTVGALVSDPSGANARSAYEYVIANDIPIVSTASTDGGAVFYDMADGIWLAFCIDGTHTFSPFFAFVEGDMRLQPKTSPALPDNKSISVVKKWDDDQNSAGQRPDSITVELLKDGTVADTAVLSAKCAWAHTFSGLSDGPDYSVREKTVKNYKVSYSGDDVNGFVITNTLDVSQSLPQTGQLWWPVGIMALAGIMFVVLGIIELRGKRNEKK